MDVVTVGYKAVFTKTLKVVCGLLLVSVTGVLRLCSNCETKARVKGGGDASLVLSLPSGGYVQQAQQQFRRRVPIPR